MFTAKAFVLATGSLGKSWKYTSNSWESTGDGVAMAAWAGADLIDMEFVQFHPTGMVWPLSVRGILVTEGVRGDGGVLRNSEGERFMFDYIPPMFAAETADTEDEGDRWYEDHTNNRRPPELLPRDEVARSINSEVKRRTGQPRTAACSSTSPRAGAPSTSAGACRRCTTSSRSWPASTSRPSPWRSGPTCHYAMGGVRVRRRLGRDHRARALRRRRGGRAGCTGPTASAGTRCPTSSSSAAAPAIGASDFAEAHDAGPGGGRGPGARRGRRGAGAARAQRRREPLRHPPRPAGDDAEPGGHHPHRVGAA